MSHQSPESHTQRKLPSGSAGAMTAGNQAIDRGTRPLTPSACEVFPRCRVEGLQKQDKDTGVSAGTLYSDGRSMGHREKKRLTLRS